MGKKCAKQRWPHHGGRYYTSVFQGKLPDTMRSMDHAINASDSDSCSSYDDSDKSLVGFLVPELLETSTRPLPERYSLTGHPLTRFRKCTGIRERVRSSVRTIHVCPRRRKSRKARLLPRRSSPACIVPTEPERWSSLDLS